MIEAPDSSGEIDGRRSQNLAYGSPGVFPRSHTGARPSGLCSFRIRSPIGRDTHARRRSTRGPHPLGVAGGDCSGPPSGGAPNGPCTDSPRGVRRAGPGAIGRSTKRSRNAVPYQPLGHVVVQPCRTPGSSVISSCDALLGTELTRWSFTVSLRTVARLQDESVLREPSLA